MNKKIIGILSAVTLLSGAVYLSGQGVFGSLSSSVLTGDACTQANLDAQKTQYEGSSQQIENLKEQISSLENNISSTEKSMEIHQKTLADKKQETKNSNQELNQLENYIRNQCDVKKASGRGGTINYSAPDCDTKKNQATNKKQHINNIKKSINEKNDTIQTAKRNIQNQTNTLRQLKNSMVEIEEFVEKYEACQMTLTNGSGYVDNEVDGEIGDTGDGTNIPETEKDDDNNTSTTVPTTPSTPIFSTPTIPATSSDTASLTMETYTPTKLDDWALWQSSWMGTRGSEYFQISFSQDQGLLGYNRDTNQLSQESLLYTTTSIEYYINGKKDGINMTKQALNSNKKALKVLEKDLKKTQTNKEKQEIQKKIKELKQYINSDSDTLTTLNSELGYLLTLKPQVLLHPKLVVTNSLPANNMIQPGVTNNYIELYHFTLQTDLPPVSVIDRIVFEVHSSSSPISFNINSMQVIEKSSQEPVLNCSQKTSGKRIIDCLPIQCSSQDRDCNPVLRDNQPHEYLLVAKLENTITSGSYAINKVDGILYNAFNYNTFNTSIINNTRPFQTIFTAGQ